MVNLVSNERESQNQGSYSSDASYRNFHIFELKSRERQLIEKYFLKNNGTVLDLGCGYGRTTVPLSKYGFKVTGIDVVPRMIETAKREFPDIDFRLMSATDLEFPDSSFDYAFFSFNGLDNIYPRVRRNLALSEIYRVMRPRGILLLTSHNSATLVTKPRKITPRIFWGTIRAGLLGSGYILGPYDGGDHTTYCRLPWLQVRDFYRAGFEVIEVIGRKNRSWVGLNLFESWPYYVLRKI